MIIYVLYHLYHLYHCIHVHSLCGDIQPLSIQGLAGLPVPGGAFTATWSGRTAKKTANLERFQNLPRRHCQSLPYCFIYFHMISYSYTLVNKTIYVSIDI